MVVKSADTKRPGQLPSTKIEFSKPTALQATKLESKVSEPSSGFAAAKKKGISITGRLKPVPVPVNSELAGLASSQLRVAQAGGVSGATAAKGPKIDAGVKDLYKALCKTSDDDANAAYKELGNAIAKGDYASAARLAETTLSQKYEEFMDEVVPPSTNKTNLTDNLKNQLKFLAKMQGAKIKADYPPTRDQLVAYFKTLDGNPTEARKALKEFNAAFEVHVAQETQDPKADVTYHGTEDAPLPPNDWADVEKRTPNAKGENVGKRVNDCEGYAFLNEQLLKAAGFELKHHLTANGGPAGAHAMVVFTHKKDPGNVTLTSNGGVHHGKNEKAVADEGFKAAGGKPGAKNAYYAGDTMGESQQHAGAGTNKI